MTSILLLLFVALPFVASAISCKRPSVPFDPSLIGQSFGRAATCGQFRFNAYSRVEFHQRNISLFPLSEDFNHGGTPSGYVCFPRMDFIFGNLPSVQILPRVIIPPNLGNDQSYCGPAQAKGIVIARPRGNKRKIYINAVKGAFKEAKLIRDYGCEVPADSPIPLPVRVNNFKNAPADAFVTYLYGVAFTFQFCL